MRRGYVRAGNRVKSYAMERTNEPGTTAPLFDQEALNGLPVRCSGVGDRCSCARCTGERQATIDRDATEQRRRLAQRKDAYDRADAAARGDGIDRAAQGTATPGGDRAVTMARWAQWCRAAVQMYGKGTPWAVLPAHRSPLAER